MAAMAASPSLAAMHIRAETDVALLTNTGAEGAAPEDDDSATALSARARLLLRRGHLEEALVAAQQSLGDAAPEGLDALLAAIDAWLVVALVADRRGRDATAIAAVGQAVGLAAGPAIVGPFLSTGSDRLATIVRGVPITGGDAALLSELRERLGAGTSCRLSAAPEPVPLVEAVTERELAVLAELPSMRSNEEIAAELFVSVNTVKSHLKHAYRKLGVANRRDAVARSRELGLIP
jgi:LuxR family maltose regulon positive regulatory protein